MKLQLWNGKQVCMSFCCTFRKNKNEVDPGSKSCFSFPLCSKHTHSFLTRGNYTRFMHNLFCFYPHIILPSYFFPINHNLSLFLSIAHITPRKYEIHGLPQTAAVNHSFSALHRHRTFHRVSCVRSCRTSLIHSHWFLQARSRAGTSQTSRLLSH